MTKRIWSGPALALILAFVVSACSQTTQPGTSAAPATATAASGVVTGGTFRFGQSGDITVLDPWNVTDGNSLLVTRQIYESLVDYEPTGFKIVPKLAESWSTSADGKVWTFNLRKGVKFHDGTDFNADAVVLNFNRAMNTKDPYRGKPIGDEYAYWGDQWNGFDTDSIITKVEAKDANTVLFTTKVAFGPFLANMAMPTFPIVSPKSIKDDVDGWMTVNTKGAAGTGPFLIKPGAWQKGQQITLEKNPTYWAKDKDGKSLPYLDKVVFRFIADESARVAELRAGSVDAIRDFSPASIPTIKADANLQIVPRPSFNIAYLGINQAVKPFDNLNVRKAIAMGIDKAAIVQAIYAGEAKAASQFLVPGMLGYDESVTEFYKFDQAAAKKLITDAGGPFTIDLWYMPVSRPYYPDPKKIAEAFASNLKDIGITANLKSEDWTPYRADARDNKFGLWLLGWTGDNGDPDNFLNVFFHPKVVAGKDTAIDAGNWSNPTAWDLLRKAQVETDSAKRADLYKQTSKIVQQDVPRIPMFHANPPTGTTKKVLGFVPHPTGGEAFSLVYLGK
ncbi:MAG TPA: ABC transporter substrate-binding protein [Methylomirabilota bacterium]|nr:ABC transporter substrate-binding protein [Methylomirabilota bacterium]